MAWVRLDDKYPDHPKVRAAGAIAELVHVRAMCYAMRHLTDGVIPESVIPSLLVGLEHIGIATGGVPGMFEVGKEALEIDWPEALVRAGLWHPRRGGYLLHDFLDYNPSKKEVLEKRKQQSDGGRLGATRRWGRDPASMGQPNGGVRVEPTGQPIQPGCSPSPYPSPSPKKKTPRSARAPIQGGSDRPESFRGGEPTRVGDVLGKALARIRTEVGDA
jgi:hypothetical protein